MRPHSAGQRQRPGAASRRPRPGTLSLGDVFLHVSHVRPTLKSAGTFLRAPWKQAAFLGKKASSFKRLTEHAEKTRNPEQLNVPDFFVCVQECIWLLLQPVAYHEPLLSFSPCDLLMSCLCLPRVDGRLKRHLRFVLALSQLQL